MRNQSERDAVALAGKISISKLISTTERPIKDGNFQIEYNFKVNLFRPI